MLVLSIVLLMCNKGMPWSDFQEPCFSSLLTSLCTKCGCNYNQTHELIAIGFSANIPHTVFESCQQDICHTEELLQSFTNSLAYL